MSEHTSSGVAQAPPGTPLDTPCQTCGGKGEIWQEWPHDRYLKPFWACPDCGPLDNPPKAAP
jgi:hypothetical protein